MKGEILINTGSGWHDAWTEYGIHLEDGAEEALMLPPEIKELPHNNMASSHGTQYFRPRPEDVRVAERELSLTFCFVWSKDDYLKRYNRFLQMLQSGIIEMKIRGVGLGFTFLYKSCRSYTSVKYAGKIVVQFSEPNPKNRIIL